MRGRGWRGISNTCLFVPQHRLLCTTSQASTIAGRATTEGTRNFVNGASLAMHHCFELRSLYVNPVIHGPPHGSRVGALTVEDGDICLAQALLRNKSNCFYVYNHYNYDSLNVNSRRTWAASSLRDIFDAGSIDRRSVVTIAGLGNVGQNASREIPARLAEALALSQLQEIDMAMVECDDDSFRDGPEGINGAIACLEQLCRDGKLSFYGLHINVTPYLYHTPPLKLVGASAMIPPMIEEMLRRDAPHADVVMYTISPTTAVPATYPMLDPDLDVELLEAQELDSDPAGEVGTATTSATATASRKVADTEAGAKPPSPAISEKTRQFSRLAMHALLCRRGGGKSNEDEVDLVSRAERLWKAASEPDPKLKADLDSEILAHAQVSSDDDAHFLPLVSNVLPPSMEKHLAEALDSLCPSLRTTPLLQDKALRIVLSVGIDAVVVDAELSSALQKTTLTPGHLLPSAATDDVFGNFILPRQLLLGPQQ